MAQPMWKGRLFVEGVVIGVSMLLAFEAVDAILADLNWSNRGNRGSALQRCKSI